MISELVAEIAENSKIEGFITPFYEKLSLLNLSSSILSFFEVKPSHSPLPSSFIERSKSSNKLVVLLVDALGYQQLEFFLKNNEGKLFRELVEKGKFSILTSTFPSTTTAAHATLHTGLSPQEHGLMGLFLYLKELRVVADMIEFKPIGKTRRDMLLDMGFNPEKFFPARTVFQMLKEKGVNSYAVIRRNYVGSGLSTMFFKEVEFVPYIILSGMFVLLRKTLEENVGRDAYVFAYWPFLDGIAHFSGPYSEEALTELKIFFYSFKKEFLEKIDSKTAEETVLIVTADHGQARISRENAVNMKEHPSLLQNLTIPFAGDPRAALEMGLFGLGQVKGEVYDRIGDLIVISRNDSSIYYPLFTTRNGVSLQRFPWKFDRRRDAYSVFLCQNRENNLAHWFLFSSKYEFF